MNSRPTFHGARFPATLDPQRFVPSLAAAPARSVKSSELFRGEREIGIEHEGSVYRLKITRQRKLILNK